MMSSDGERDYLVATAFNQKIIYHAWEKQKRNGN